LDHRRTRAGRLILAAVAAFAVAAVAGETAPPLKALGWLAPGPDAARTLATAPRECLAKPAKPEDALTVEVGRAAFRTPVLLGGQAARAGLACESCHQAGRGNPQFQFPGVSGAPGTADVTSSLFSTHRGNGMDDPRPIPDLSGPRSALKIDQARESGALEAFIRGLIVEEFDGPEPAPVVLQGLAAYVRALGPAACPGERDEPLSARRYLEDSRRAVRAAMALARRGDRPAAILMIASARARLGLIHERFSGPGLAAERARLQASDRALARAAETLRSGGPAQAELMAWLSGAAGLERALARREAASLFNPARLTIAASSALPREGR
jgi:hypothetical protein